MRLDQGNALGRIASLLIVAAACLGMPGASAQPVSPPDDAPCPAPAPPPAGLAALMDRMLVPGQTFSLSGISPETMAQIASYMQQAAARQARDWPNLCRYAAENAAVLAGGRRPQVVFMGDSITENWLRGDPSLFGPTVLDRGISGQTTPQMLLRMYPDVIALRPAMVHIMAGTNDISGNTGPQSDRTIVDNIRAMIVLAKAARIRVVLGSITPSAGFVMRPDVNPSARIVRVNGLLRRLAAEQRVTFVDYHAPLADAAGGIRAGLANDGLHPNRDGYAVMRPLAERAIARAAGR